MLPCLRHRAVCGGNDQNSAVHLGGARDHILYIVGMTWAIHMGIMAQSGLVFNVSSRNGNAALLLFRRFVDFTEVSELGHVFGRQNPGDCRRQSCFAMVNVTDCSYIDMRLCPLKFFLRH